MPRAPRKTKTTATTTDAGTMQQSPAQPPPPTEILPIPALSKSAIAKAREMAEAIVRECAVMVDVLVVTTPADYHAADDILHKIKVTQKRLDEPFEIIKPIRQGLDRVYALRREVENPLLDMEVTVKDKMRAYKIEESKRLELEEQERQRKQRELEAAERATQPVQAPIPFVTGLQVVHPVVEVAPATYLPPTQPIRAASSSATKIIKWRIHDFALFVKAVDMGMIPIEALRVDDQKMDEWLKANQVILESFPGCETYEDFRISGR